MTADDKAVPDPRRPPPHPVTPPVAGAGEQRTLTTEEFRQLDTMLGGQDFPTLIRPDNPPPAARHTSGLLQTLVVGIILLAIIALALYLFR